MVRDGGASVPVRPATWEGVGPALSNAQFSRARAVMAEERVRCALVRGPLFLCSWADFPSNGSRMRVGWVGFLALVLLGRCATMCSHDLYVCRICMPYMYAVYADMVASPKAISNVHPVCASLNRVLHGPLYVSYMCHICVPYAQTCQSPPPTEECPTECCFSVPPPPRAVSRGHPPCPIPLLKR